jgi:hypothetical protein
MCGKHYVVNPLTPVGDDPNVACPALIGKRLAPISPRFRKRLANADPDLEAKGQKLKGVEVSSSGWDTFVSGSWGPAPALPSHTQSIATSSDTALGAVQPIVK